jgi:effector-binding domain-containing protein
LIFEFILLIIYFLEFTMKIVKWILLVIVSVIVLGLIAALFMPPKFRVERTIEINKPVELVFDQCLDLNKSNLWGPWYKYEPSAYKSVTGNGVGQISTWEGDTVGTGTLKVTAFEQNKSISQLLNFEKPMQSGANVSYKFVTTTTGVKVSWIIESDLGYPIGRFMKGSIEKSMETDFDKGLANLKKTCESIADEPKIVEKMFPGFKLYVINDKGFASEVSAKFGSAYGEIQQFIQKNKLEFAGAPIAINNEYNMKTTFYDFDAGIPVKDNSVKPTGRIKQLIFNPSKVVMGVHIGPYQEVIKTYTEIEKYIKVKGLQVNGKSFEEYVNDPGNTPVEKLRTNIYYLVK